MTKEDCKGSYAFTAVVKEPESEKPKVQLLGINVAETAAAMDKAFAASEKQLQQLKSNPLVAGNANFDCKITRDRFNNKDAQLLSVKLEDGKTVEGRCVRESSTVQSMVFAFQEALPENISFKPDSKKFSQFVTVPGTIFGIMAKPAALLKQYMTDEMRQGAPDEYLPLAEKTEAVDVRVFVNDKKEVIVQIKGFCMDEATANAILEKARPGVDELKNDKDMANFVSEVTLAKEGAKNVVFSCKPNMEVISAFATLFSNMSANAGDVEVEDLSGDVEVEEVEVVEDNADAAE